jgi:predicted RNA binding protein YcfA (HicA-like mRNA interferase family)
LSFPEILLTTCSRKLQLAQAEACGYLCRLSSRSVLLVQRKLLRKLISGHLHNVEFQDFVKLVEAFDFKLLRTFGSHHIFSHRQIPEMINLQNVKGQAKPYQIRQFLRLVEKYNIKMTKKD